MAQKKTLYNGSKKDSLIMVQKKRTRVGSLFILNRFSSLECQTWAAGGINKPTCVVWDGR